MSLDANALVTLAEAKTYLGISGSDDDTLLENLINSSSTAIESYTDRKFIEEEYKEFYNAVGQRRLRLRNYPVSQIDRVAYGSKLAFTVNSTVATDLRTTIEVQDNKVHLERHDSAGASTQTTLTFGSNPTSSALVTAINAVTGFSATLNTNCLSDDLYRSGGVNLINSPAQIYFPDQDDTSYRLHEDRATIEFIDSSDYAFFNTGRDTGIRLPTSFSGVKVEYKAGYEDVASIPKDLKQACNLMVQYLFNLSKQDTTLASESIGAYSYSTATELLTGENQISMLLAPYVDRK